MRSPRGTRWQKKGLVYAPAGDLWWARSHAHLPTVDPTVRDVIRVYFTALDASHYGRIGRVDLDVEDPSRILAASTEPLLDLGEIGTFDDCGVVASSVVAFQGCTYLYYHGFQRTERVPYLLFTGRARVSPDGELQRLSRVPVLDRTESEPFLRAAPCVLAEGDRLRMWYVSGESWSESHGGLHYRCVIRHATSRDGVTWESRDPACIEPHGEDEYAVGRPCVVYEDGFYRMWYSRRSFRELYTMGYAESADGMHWERKDGLAGLAKSAAGWDEEMVCYPAVTAVGGRRLMFYNGNRRGASGFGFAVLEES